MGSFRKVPPDEAVRLFREGMSINQIAARFGCTASAVSLCIRKLVPADERGRILARTRGRPNRTGGSDATHPSADSGGAPPDRRDGEPGPGEGEIATWAGAFRALATYCRRQGHDDAWEYAEAIARRKDMVGL